MVSPTRVTGAPVGRRSSARAPDPPEPALTLEHPATATVTVTVTADGPPSRRAAWCALAGCGVALFLVAAWSSSFAGLSETAAARLSVLVVIGCVLLCVRAQPRGVWACSSVYLITLSVFHFGVAAMFATGTSFDRLRAQYDFRWLAVYPMSELFAVATLGVVSATVGVAALTCWRAVCAPEAVPAPAPEPGAVVRPDLRAPVGFVVLTASAAGLVAIVLGAGGLSLLFGSYADAGQTALRAPLVPYVLFGMGLGLVLAAVGGPSRWRRRSLVVFALLAVVALPLGLRGEVLFPAVSAAAVAARRRVLLRGVVVLVGAVALLALIGGLREIRESGLAAARLSAITFSPVDGIAELGASIRPIGAVLEWRDELGERPGPGSTLYGQLDRLVEGRLLGRPQPSQFSDERLFNVLMMNREGPIGGSPIAEAYYDFGASGVVVFLMATGLVLAWMDHGRRGRGSETACVVLLVPLVVEVRNAFAAVPFQVLLGLAVLGLIRLLETLTARRASRRCAESALRSTVPATRSADAVPRPVMPAPRFTHIGPRPGSPGSPGSPGMAPNPGGRPWPSALAGSLPAARSGRPGRYGFRQLGSTRERGIGATGAVVTGWLGLAAVASLGQAVLTARMLPVDRRGALVVLLTVSGLGALVGGLGTNVAFRHFHGRADPRVGLGDYLGLSLAVAPVAAVLVTVVCLPLLALTGGARADGALAVAVALLACGNLLGAQLLDALNATGSVGSAAALSAGTSLAQMGLLLVGPRHPSLVQILVVLTTCWATQAVVCVLVLARSGLCTRPRRDREAWRLLVRTGLPALGLNLGATVAFRFDRLLVAAFGGAAAASVYSVASASCEALRLVPTSVGQVVFHRAARGGLTQATLRRVTGGVLAVLVAAAAVLVLGAPWLVRSLFGAGYATAVTPMRLLLVAELLLAPFLVESRVLTGVGRTAAAGGVGLLGLLVSLAAYPAFVPWLGPTGGAVGSMLAYAVMTLLAHRAVRADRGPAWGAATPVVARAARPCPPRRSAARPGPCPPREPQ